MARLWSLTVRVVEATELIALDVFNTGARQITLGDVEHYVHELRAIPTSAGAVVARRPGSCVPIAC